MARATASIDMDTSTTSVDQLLTEIRRTARPAQVEPDIHTAPSAISACVTARVRSGVRGEAFDELDDSAASERPQRRPHRDAACASGEFGHKIHGVGGARIVADEVARVRGERRLHGTRARDDCDATVVGNIERLVRVGRPRVCRLDAVKVGRPAIARCSPQSKRAIHVHPRSVPVRETNCLPERIERARVQVARLQGDDHGTVRCRKRRLRKTKIARRRNAQLRISAQTAATSELDADQRETLSRMTPVAANQLIPLHGNGPAVSVVSLMRVSFAARLHP